MKRSFSLAVFPLVLIGTVILSLLHIQPPPAASASIDLKEFSSARALEYVRAITAKPHPVGTSANEEVREYLLRQFQSLGLEPQIQKTTSTLTFDIARSAVVHNIIAIRKGAANTKALLLVAHYDSAPIAPGAGDDGYAVGAILEILRALQQHPQLKNDLIILLTDGEEMGLLGATAFAEESPLMPEAGFVINLEGRGNSGPSIMFETGENNGWVIRQFAESVDAKIGSSLTYDLYKLLPNNTDFTVFKREGVNGLNVAHIGNVEYYHSALDDVQHLDERTLQHHGVNVLQAALHFGNLDLSNTAASDAVYFNFLWPSFVLYPISWTIPLASFATLLTVVVIVVGVRKNRVQGGKLLVGLGVFLLRLIVASGLVYGLWQGFRTLQPEHGLFYLDTVYNGSYYLLAFLAFSAAIALAWQQNLSSKAGIINLALGAHLLWLIGTWLTAFFFKRGSYLFIWPLLAGLVGVLAGLFDEEKNISLRTIIVQAACAIPTVYLFPQLISLLYSAMTLMIAPVLAVLVVLVVGVLQLQFSWLPAGRPWLVPGAFVFVAVALIGLALLRRDFNEQRPKPNSLIYALDADQHKAWWASWERTADEWTGQVLSQQADTMRLTQFFPYSNRPLLAAQAQVMSMSPPALEVMSDHTSDTVRILRLRIQSTRASSIISLHIPPQVYEARVNGKTVGEFVMPQLPRHDRGFLLFHFGSPAEPPEFELTVAAGKPLDLRVMDMTYGFPDSLTLSPRPPWMIPRAFVTTDVILVTKSFVL